MGGTHDTRQRAPVGRDLVGQKRGQATRLFLFLALGAGWVGACSRRPIQYRDAPPVFRLRRVELRKQPSRRDPQPVATRLRRGFLEPVTAFLSLSSSREARNTNSVDLTPDSSWFSNSRALGSTKAFYLGQPLEGSEAEAPPGESMFAVGGGLGPSILGTWTVFAAGRWKSGPWVAIRDARKRAFLLQFDDPKWPGLRTSSTLVAGELLRQAGYNVPRRYMVFFKKKRLSLASRGGVPYSHFKAPLKAIWWSLKKSPQAALTQTALEGLLRRVRRERDGSMRALATALPPPKRHRYIGPFPLWGRRRDDPNDRFLHQDLRELRGLRIFAAWLGLRNLDEMSGADFYDQKERVLTHYLWEFGGALGAGPLGTPKSVVDAYGEGDLEPGVRKAAQEMREKDLARFPEIGYLPVRGFHVADWAPATRHPAFERVTRRDRFWAGRVLAQFRAGRVKSIISGAFLSKKAARMLWAKIWLRRRRALRHGLSGSLPLVRFSAAMAIPSRLRAGDSRRRAHRSASTLRICATPLKRRRFSLTLFDAQRKKPMAEVEKKGGRRLEKRGKRRRCWSLRLKSGVELPAYWVATFASDGKDSKDHRVDLHLRCRHPRGGGAEKANPPCRVSGVVRR